MVSGHAQVRPCVCRMLSDLEGWKGEMMYNLEELTRLRDWARFGGTEKERFDHGSWARQVAGGVVLCFASKVCADAGLKFDWRYGTARQALDKGGRPISIMPYAAQLLGLGPMESTVLFAPDHEEGDNWACSFAFLDVLIERARAGKDSMSDREALDWMNEWFEANMVEDA